MEEEREKRKESGREGQGNGTLALAVGRGSKPLASPSYRLTLVSTGLSTAGMS